MIWHLVGLVCNDAKYFLQQADKNKNETTSMINAESINETDLLSTMTLGERIKRVREIRGINQKKMATKMKVTAQTYGNFEDGVNLKYSNLKKFCDIAHIDMPFLLSEDVPVTENNIEFFDRIKDKCFLLTHEQMRQKVEVYTDLLQLSEEDPSRENLSRENNTKNQLE